MDLLPLLVLSIIQGVTEFLPISSSGHLILFPSLTGQEDQGLTIDVAVHVGTLAAVMLYFRADVALVARGLLKLVRGDRAAPEARLALLLAAATVPVVVAGLVLALSGAAEALRSITVIAWATILWGVALWVADRFPPQRMRFEDWGWRDAAVMGLAQACALIPGTSRSGVTMTAARALGYARVDAARLSMLMSMPTIAAAGLVIGADLARSGDAALGADAALAAALAFVSALAALWGLMRMLQRFSMTPFVVYRLILGAVLLWIAYA